MTRRVKVACATITPSGRKVWREHAAPRTAAVKADSGGADVGGADRRLSGWTGGGRETEVLVAADGRKKSAGGEPAD